MFFKGFIMIFNKESLSVEEQLNLLIERGLIVEDYCSAINILKRIGYYHLSSYMRNFQITENHKFITNTTFSDIINLYNFDKELRHITFNSIEKIEIAYRAAISNIMCKLENSHWFYNAQYFISTDEQKDIIELISREIKKKKKEEKNTTTSELENNKRKLKYAETFIAKYYEKYDSPELPPFWMVLETFSLGSLNRLYYSLKYQYKRLITDYLGFTVDASFVALHSNWLQPLCMVRNFCAHHSRLFNRTFKIKTKQHKKIAEFLNQKNNCYYYISIVINYYLKTISNDDSYENEIINLFKKYKNIDKTKLGFPDNWSNYTITRINTKNIKQHI